MPTNDKVTIAVVSWNTRELLVRCMRSLEPDEVTGRHAVWVVDNGSTDGSVEAVREQFPWVNLLLSEENVGFGAAVNLVAARTRTPWLVSANADIEVPHGAIDALIEAAERHPRAGAVAPRLKLPSGETQLSTFAFPRIGVQALAMIGAHRLTTRRARVRGGADIERAVDYAMGAFLLFRRTAFETIGGFDDRQWMYSEDMDVSWRLRQAGWATWYAPATTVVHVGGAATETAFAGRAATMTLAAHFAWLERNRGRPAMLAFAGLNLAGAGARLVLLVPLATVCPARWARRRGTVVDWWRMNRDALAIRRSTERR